MGRRKRRTATPASLKSTHGPNYYRLQHGDVITTDKTLQTDAGSRAKYPLLIDAMVAGKIITPEQYEAGLKYHKIFHEAGRIGGISANYDVERKGPSDRRDDAESELFAIEKYVKAQQGENAMRLMVSVCGRNMLPEGQRWREPLAAALQVMSRAF